MACSPVLFHCRQYKTMTAAPTSITELQQFMISSGTYHSNNVGASSSSHDRSFARAVCDNGVSVTIEHHPIRINVHRDNVTTEPVQITLHPEVHNDVTGIRTTIADNLHLSPFQSITLYVQMDSGRLREVQTINDLLQPAVTNVFVVHVSEVFPDPELGLPKT
eukprot:PhF_6_TR8750/c2_g3_i1/m.13780